MAYLENIDEKRQKRAAQKRQAELIKQLTGGDDEAAKRVAAAITKESIKSRNAVQKVEVTNPTKVDVEVDLQEASDWLKQILLAIRQIPKTEIPELPKSMQISNLIDNTDELERIVQAIEAQEITPQVNIEQGDVTVDVDTKAVAKEIEKVVKRIDAFEKAVSKFKVEVPDTDLNPLVEAVNSVKQAVNSLEFPIPNYVLPFKDASGKATQVELDSSGNLPVAVSLATKGDTATVTTVADTATSTTLLSANSGRYEATITNDSSADLYIKLGTTASTTSYTVKIAQDESYIVNTYTGRIDGIWSSDPNDGAARITEIT